MKSGLPACWKKMISSNYTAMGFIKSSVLEGCSADVLIILFQFSLKHFPQAYLLHQVMQSNSHIFWLSFAQQVLTRDHHFFVDICHILWTKVCLFFCATHVCTHTHTNKTQTQAQNSQVNNKPTSNHGEKQAHHVDSSWSMRSVATKISRPHAHR